MSIQNPTPSDGGPRLLDRVRDALRQRHYSYRTEQAYIHWIKRYIFFHDKKHPAQMGADEITAFLTYLARERSVAAATQNQALSALLFLYGEVLGEKLPWMDGIVRAKRPIKVPVVLKGGRGVRVGAWSRGPTCGDVTAEARVTTAELFRRVPTDPGSHLQAKACRHCSALHSRARSTARSSRSRSIALSRK